MKGWRKSTAGTATQAATTRILPKNKGRSSKNESRRGPLLGVVQIRVYENGCEFFVTLPRDAVLGLETDQSEVAAMVARARARLLFDWR
jgi:hypothetical protein